MQTTGLHDEITIKEEILEETIIDASSPGDNTDNYPENFSEADSYIVNPIELDEDLVDVYQPWDNDEVEIIPVESPKTVDLTENENENRPKSTVPNKSNTPPLPEPIVEKLNQLKRKSVDTTSINHNGGIVEPAAAKKAKNSVSSTSLNQSVDAQSQTDCLKDTVVIKKTKPSESLIISKKSSNTDFESFGNFVADQLQRIPLNRALRAQLTITTILTELRVLSAEESSSQMLSSDDDK